MKRCTCLIVWIIKLKRLRSRSNGFEEFLLTWTLTNGRPPAPVAGRPFGKDPLLLFPRTSLIDHYSRSNFGTHLEAFFPICGWTKPVPSISCPLLNFAWILSLSESNMMMMMRMRNTHFDSLVWSWDPSLRWGLEISMPRNILGLKRVIHYYTIFF